MTIKREDIYAALFAAVSQAGEFVTTSRRLRMWGDVAQDEQPALFMVQRPETVIQRKGVPAKHELLVDFFVYVNTGEDERSVPATILNPLVDAIEATLTPDPVTGFYNLVVMGDTTTCTIAHCWIEGEIQNDEGILGAQAVAIIPVKIEAL
jgi:hypothetical protein